MDSSWVALDDPRSDMAGTKKYPHHEAMSASTRQKVTLSIHPNTLVIRGSVRTVDSRILKSFCEKWYIHHGNPASQTATPGQPGPLSFNHRGAWCTAHMR